MSQIYIMFVHVFFFTYCCFFHILFSHVLFLTYCYYYVHQSTYWYTMECVQHNVQYRTWHTWLLGFADAIGQPGIREGGLGAAPSPLPKNWGHAARLAHIRDLAMMTLLNGRERTAEELAALAEQAGLKVVKIWPCRSLIWITELRLDSI